MLGLFKQKTISEDPLHGMWYGWGGSWEGGGGLKSALNTEHDLERSRMLLSIKFFNIALNLLQTPSTLLPTKLNIFQTIYKEWLWVPVVLYPGHQRNSYSVGQQTLCLKLFIMSAREVELEVPRMKEWLRSSNAEALCAGSRSRVLFKNDISRGYNCRLKNATETLANESMKYT